MTEIISYLQNIPLSSIKRLPQELIREISSYEYEYINYCNDYATISWEDLENTILNYTEDYYMDYFVEEVENIISTIDTENVTFEKANWLMPDYIKMPGGGKKWYYSDEGMDTLGYVNNLIEFLQNCDEQIIEGDNRYYYKLKEINSLYKFISEFKDNIEDDID